MFTVYRIAKTKFARLAFDGIGSKVNGGRWNFVGFPMVYASENASLACLVTLSHLDAAYRDETYRIIEAQITSDLIELVERSKLPKGWSADEYGRASQKFGTDWLISLRSVALKVPSVLIPKDGNILINPLHPDFKKIVIGKPKRFVYHPNITSKLLVPDDQ